MNGEDWRTVQRWSQRHKAMDDFVWRELRSGASFYYEPEGAESSQGIRHPDDLHDPKHWA